MYWLYLKANKGVENNKKLVYKISMEKRVQTVRVESNREWEFQYTTTNMYTNIFLSFEHILKQFKRLCKSF